LSSAVACVALKSSGRRSGGPLEGRGRDIRQFAL
jgi:hypothetical protein